MQTISNPKMPPSLCCFFLTGLSVFLLVLGVPHPMVFAGDLSVTPENPSVAAGGSIQLSVTGAAGTVIWNAAYGSISGQGQTVVYTAPNAEGVDFVMVVSGDAAMMVEITILPGTGVEIPVTLENAVWEIFTNRNWITAMAYSTDGNTLWVGTNGGLEQQDSETGQVVRVHTRSQGLSDNRINVLLADENGIWAGTRQGGLGFLKDNGVWKTYNTSNSGLPDNKVFCLASDGNNGIWAGTESGGLARLDADGVWKVFSRSNSDIPDDEIRALFLDSHGGLWMGTGTGGIARRSLDGTWTVMNTQNSGLPDNQVNALAEDGSGGLWAGTQAGLAHYSTDGTWTVYSQTTSHLPDHRIRTLLSDGDGGVWVGTEFGGLAHLTKDGTWQIFDVDTSNLPYDEITVLLPHSSAGIWVGTFEGLCRMDPNGTLTVVERGEAGLPYNYMYSLHPDGLGGIWAGTLYGLGHMDANGQWSLYYEAGQLGEGLPSHDIQSLLDDGAGGMWFGTNNGLARMRINGSWTVYTFETSELPAEAVTGLSHDGRGGIWIGTEGGGLANLSSQGLWQVMDTGNSDLPDDRVTSLLSDESGGVWTATMNGLGHLKADGSWTVFTTANSDLPKDEIHSLASDGYGGVWIGTWEGGIAHLLSNGAWEFFTSETSDLPNNSIRSLLNTDTGGLWAGTYFGLAYRSPNGTWVVFDTANSDLPDSDVMALIHDETGGVWAATWGGGLGHLTFGEKEEIARSVTDADTWESLISGNRYAIVVHPRGGTGYEQDISIEFMASYTYKTLLARGYDNDEIYLLSYKPDMDINGDGMADRNVVDGPVTWADLAQGSQPRDITLDDVRAAFAAAKAKGSLDVPLVFVFSDHGLKNALRLDPFDGVLSASDLKQLLDDYQETTGNSVVAVLEACHSGTLVDELSGPNRIVITSTGEELAYYDNLGMLSFSRLFFSLLKKGSSFYDAFSLTATDLLTFGFPFEEQVPRMDDDGDGAANTNADGTLSKTLCLNGCWGGLSGDITLESMIAGKTVAVGETVDLSVKAGITQGGIASVWAVVVTPETAAQRDAQGYSLNRSPMVELAKGDGNVWSGAFSGFEYRGDYAITFMARDNEGFVFGASPVTFTVANGPAPPDGETVCLQIPTDLSIPVSCADYQGNKYAFTLIPKKLSDLTWQLDPASLGPAQSIDRCITVEPDLSFAVNCADYNGSILSFDLTLISDRDWIWQLNF